MDHFLELRLLNYFAFQGGNFGPVSFRLNHSCPAFLKKDICLYCEQFSSCKGSDATIELENTRML